MSGIAKTSNGRPSGQHDDGIAHERAAGSQAEPAALDDGEAVGPLQAALLRSATTLVKDPAEAQALVALALSDARQAGGRSVAPAQADLFRLLRRAYHSIERSRPRRPMRDAVVNSLALEQGRSSAGQGD